MENRMTQAAAPADQAQQAEALVERLFGELLGAITTCGVYIGDRLGLYRALSDGAPSPRTLPRARASPTATPASGWSSRPPMAFSCSSATHRIPPSAASSYRMPTPRC
jgi:hypothetical protein